MIHQYITDLEYIPSGVDYEDLFQIGQIALWKAAEDYDPYMGCSFSTYSYYQIQREIMAYLRMHTALKRKAVVGHNSQIECSIEVNVINTMLTDEIIQILSADEYDLLHDYYVKEISLADLGVKLGLTKRKLQWKIGKLKKKVKDNMRMDTE